MMPPAHNYSAFIIKGCPECSGAVQRREDEDGFRYLSCYNCGWVQEGWELGNPTIMPPRRRMDIDVDQADWTDTGCHVSPSCLSCPLPVCKYDAQGGERQKMVNAKKDDERLAIYYRLTADGLSNEDIATILEISPRTLRRLLARERDRKGRA